MSERYERWPALRGFGAWPPDPLACERAVWGKVHGAASDYRWIARSAGFQGADGTLAAELNLGSEDRVVRAPFWRAFGGTCFAGSLYRSRAVDAAGRAATVEKQVFEWRRPPDAPAALGALLLLPRVGQATDAVWWGQERGRTWSDPDFALPIPAAPLLPVAEEEITRVIAEGCRELAETVPFDELQQFFSTLLAGVRPAVLAGLGRPLGPAALAALLLPLERETSDRLSLAGWVPSSRFSLEVLGARWDALLLADAPIPSAGEARPPIDSAIAKRARQMARALFEASGPARQLLPSIEELRSESLFASEESPPATATPAESTASPKTQGPEAVVRPAADRRYRRPPPPLSLTSPPVGSPEVVEILHAFARDPDRRQPDRLLRDCDVWARRCPGSEVPFAPDTLAAQPLLRWPAEVAGQRPPEANPAQWLVKVDLLRAAALALVPAASTLASIGPPQDPRIPALLFAPLLPRQSRDRLAAFGAVGLEKLVVRSLSCPYKPLRCRVEHTLSEWRSTTGDPQVQRMLAEALRAEPTPAS
jgi:hypothetical protein